MPTLIYSPQVELLIDTDRNGLLDVSSDLVRGSVTLNTDSSGTLHSMQVVLINGRRKYDGVFTPNDRFVFKMKRLRWVPVMSGYLDSVPFFSIYPDNVSLRGSCTLKRLKNWLIDPNTNTWRELMSHQGDESTSPDLGIGNKITRAFKIAEWDKEKIHLGGYPTDYLTRMTELQARLSDRIDFGNKTLEATATIGGGSVAAGAAGTAAGSVSGAQVAQAAAHAGFSGESLVTIVAIAKRESGWNATNQGDIGIQTSVNGPSVGLWQVRTEKAQSHTGGFRDFYALIPGGTPGVKFSGRGDMDFQAAAAWEISGRGVNFRPWTVYRNGLSAADMDAARQAVQQMNSGGQLSAVGQPLVTGTLGSQPASGSGSGAPAQKILAAAYTQLGHGRTEVNPDRFNGPKFDCSGFTWWAHNQAGVTLPQTVSDAYFNLARSQGKLLDQRTALGIAGAIIGNWGSGNNGHIAMSWGDNKNIIDCGSSVKFRPWWFPSDGVGGLLPGVNYPGAGTVGPGDYAGLLGAGTGPLAVDLWDPPPVGVDIADMYGGMRAVINDTGLLEAVTPLIQASMRSFCSAPNGDFIAWFPDYFDQYDMAGKMVIQDTEVKSFTVGWSDDRLITHQFVTGTAVPNDSFISETPVVTTWSGAVALTSGIATVEFPEIMEAIFGKFDSQSNSRVKDLFSSANKIFDRFGARNNWAKHFTMSRDVEFWLAIRLFTKSWTEQFSVNIPITWMPEVFPGMILKFPTFDVKLYCEGVTHTFDFESGNFSTVANTTTPSAISGKGIFDIFPSAANLPEPVAGSVEGIDLSRGSQFGSGSGSL